MNLWTVRHPPTQSKGLCVGQLAVPVLVPRDEAKQRVIDKAPLTPPIIWSSDLPRCKNLAADLAANWGVAHHVDPRLREISMGEWEGRTFDDLYETDTERWNIWCSNWITQATPGGESMLDVEKRVQGWLRNCFLQPDTLLVAHAGVVRVIRCLLGEERSQAFACAVPHLVWEKHLFGE